MSFRLVLAAMLPSVAVSANCPISAYFRDPKHYKEGTFAGSRFVTTKAGDKETDDITLIGSDDGVNFWTLHGKQAQTRCDIVVDFSPKGGPASLSGRYEPETKAIVWSDTNFWNEINIPDFAWGTDSATDKEIAGVYWGSDSIKPKTWAGVRMISDSEGDKKGDDLTLIGTDDGKSFWMLKGKSTGTVDGKAGITVDFSPVGGAISSSGTFANGEISWKYITSWPKKTASGNGIVQV